MFVISVCDCNLNFFVNVSSIILAIDFHTVDMQEDLNAQNVMMRHFNFALSIEETPYVKCTEAF